MPDKLRQLFSPRVLKLVVALAIVELLVVGADFPLWQRVVLKEFDLLTMAAAPYAQRFPIYVVGIDDNSLQVIGERWPWPRSLHAKLIRKMHEAGAAVVAFDVLFDHPTTKAQDEALASAIRDTGMVVLARGSGEQETQYGTIWVELNPIRPLLDAGALTGSIDVQPDGDRYVRQPPTADDAFFRVITRRLQQAHPDLNPDLAPAPRSLIRYVGPEQTFSYISFYQALEPEKYLREGDLEGALILVGRTSESATDIGVVQTDMFYTPFTHVTTRLMPGIEIHANMIEGALARDRLLRSPDHWELALLLSAGLLAVLAGWRLSMLWQGVVTLTGAAVLAFAGWRLFVHEGLWLPVTPAITALLAIYLTHSFLAYWSERRQRVAIRNMFALYVPEKVVEDLAAHPERLQLGGEQRDVTLLFSDLAGFTSLSERMTPVDVAAMLNDYFSQMTDVIFQQRGTVDKFIGDAIMAFWGAPAADPEQAFHAVSAAIGMIEALPGVNARLKDKGLPPVSMRIGINSGAAVVGNLGSPTRFSYTALGDSVNLASRLEGVNKYYGTLILVSGETARLLDGRIALRPVDRIRVKGKEEAVDILTPCADPALTARTSAMLEVYRARDWDRAASACAEMLAAWPGDPVATTFAERIAEYRDKSPPPDWDGSYILDAK